MRREFSKTVRLQAANRAKGRCEGCGKKLAVGEFHYDHDTPDGLGGEPTLENCKVLCLTCHRIKTHEQDNPRMQKADAQRKSIALAIRPEPTIQSRGFDKRPAQRRASAPLAKPLPARRITQ